MKTETNIAVNVARVESAALNRPEPTSGARRT